MTCGEFLKALQEHPNAELVFEQMMEPPNDNGRAVKQMDNLDLWMSEYRITVSHDPYKFSHDPYK